MPSGSGKIMTRLIAGVLLVIALTPGLSPAQAPEASRDIVATVEKMRGYTQALGVTCAYCHVERPDGRLDYRANDNPRKQSARDMIAMTNDVNAMIAMSRPSPVPARVDCMTCHHGVAIPRQLTEVIKETVEQRGGAAAADQYRALHKQYYGGQSYDFSEAPLLSFIQSIIDA